MIDIAAIRATFPEFGELQPLAEHGQKLVLQGVRDKQVVALKLIKPTEQDRERTDREIAAVLKLASSYVPQVFDHGVRSVGDDERIFLVEQFIEGTTYRAVLTDRPRQPLENVLSLARVLLAACADFEKASLVHRDIKPENLMIGSDGKTWVIDFGLVRFLDLESLTATSRRYGPCTLGYGAPEQLRNLKPQINVRADLFSVGVVLYESLHGANPYWDGKRDALEVIRHMESQNLPSLADADGVDPRLAEFIGALSARFPSRRPQSAAEALEWFETIAARLEEGD